MWIVPVVLFAASVQDQLPPLRTPVLSVSSGDFAVLHVSSDRGVGIDLASMNFDEGGSQVSVDAFFFLREPNVVAVTGVPYSGFLPSQMLRASVRVDCVTRRVEATRWSYLTDLGYSLDEFSAEARPMSPEPSGGWALIVQTSCSEDYRAGLATQPTYAQFHRHMETEWTGAAIRALAR